MKSFVMVVLMCISLTACGESDPGGSGGSTGTSGSSGSASGGSGAGSTGGAGGAGGAPGCSLASDACEACVEEHCAPTLMACSSVPACETATPTLETCGCDAQQSGESVEPCLDQFKEGSAEAVDVVTCVEQSCSTECGL